jgi:hypothetical protein
MRLAPATITLVQSIGKAAFTAGGTVLHIPASTGVAAGHGIVVELAVNKGTTPYQTQITDSAGNTYLHDATLAGQGVEANLEADMFSSMGIYAIPAGGQITIQFNISVKAAAATAQEFYGLEPNVGTDNLGTANSFGNNSNPNSSVSTFTPNDLVLAASAVAADPTIAFGPGTGSKALPGAGVSAFNGGPAVDIDPAYTIGATANKSYSAGVQLLFGKTAPWATSISAYTGDPTTHLKVTASVVSVAPNTGFNVTLQALQSNGNPDINYTGRIHFTSSDNVAALPADYTFTAADFGVHTFRNVTLGTLDSTLHPLSTITATDTIDGTISGVVSVKATPPPGTHIVVSAPASTLVNTQFNVSITVIDGFNNVLLGYNGTVHFTSSDLKATLPANYTFTVGMGGDNGVHTFSNVILRTPASDTITATDTATSAITGTTTVSALTTLASALTLTGFPSPTIAGAARNFTVTARDALGNRLKAFRGTVHFMSSDPHAILPPSYTFTSADQGLHVFHATFVTGGLNWLATTLGANPAISGRQSGISVISTAIAALSNALSSTYARSLPSTTPEPLSPASALAVGGRPSGNEVTSSGEHLSLAPQGLSLRPGAHRVAIRELLVAVVDDAFANPE